MEVKLEKKIEDGLSTALGAVRAQVKAGVLDPEHFKRITREIFTDPMTGMGNKKAYSDFLSRPRPGVHVRIDGNDFGSINKAHGFEAGDGAIRSMGTAIREALQQVVGKKYAKSYRLGGDEFHLHVPDARSAARFARAVREKLEAVAPIGGTHGLSLSIGMGDDPVTAEKALIQAKTSKKLAGYKEGQARTHVHSMIPGAEGAIPVENTVKPALAPPTVKPAEPVAVTKNEATLSGYMPDCIHCGKPYMEHSGHEACPKQQGQFHQNQYWEGPTDFVTGPGDKGRPVIKTEKEVVVVHVMPPKRTPLWLTKTEAPPAPPEPVPEPTPPATPPAPPPPAEPAMKAEDIAVAVAKSIAGAMVKTEDIAAAVAKSVAAAMEKATPAPPPPPAAPAPTPPTQPQEVEFIRDDEGRVTGARLKHPST
jgi:GGDEF domain-containing protein